MLPKTNDVQKSEWLVLHFPLRSHSCLASGRPLHQLMIHSGAVTLCKFRMLTRWYRGGSSSCSLNNIPLVPKLRLPSLRRQFVGFPRCTCDVVSTFHCFVRVGYLIACTFDSLCFLSPVCTTFEILIKCHPEMMLHGLMVSACLTEVPCQTSCPDPPLQTDSTNHHVRCCLSQRFLCCCS